MTKCADSNSVFKSTGFRYSTTIAKIEKIKISKRLDGGCRSRGHSFVSRLDSFHAVDVLEVGDDIGEGSEVDLEVAHPRKNNVEVSVGDGEVVADQELLGTDELVVNVLQLRSGLVAIVLRKFGSEGWVEERPDGSMQLGGDVGQSVLHHVSLRSAISGGDFGGTGGMVGTAFEISMLE